jgi:hypothetical protein
MSLGVFNGRARAHLLNVGIIRPAAHVSAVMINEFLSDDAGAPVDCGKISDQDKGDVPRFLNRCGAVGPVSSPALVLLLKWCWPVYDRQTCSLAAKCGCADVRTDSHAATASAHRGTAL